MVSRRTFLRSVGVAGVGALAGCNASPLESGGTAAAPSLVKSTVVSAEHSNFGQAVALGDDLLVVGADHASGRAAHRTGAAFLYEREGDAWVNRARLRPHPEDTAGPFEESALTFGSSVAVEDGTVVVASAHSASLYTFERVDDEWTRTASCYPLGSSRGVGRLLSVDFDGDTLAVSTRPAPNTDRRDDEVVHVYRRDGRDWSRTARLTHDSPPLEYDRFGQSVAVDGDTLAAVSATDDTTVHPQVSVHVYHQYGSEWQLETVLEPSKPPDIQIFSRFDTVALRGDTLAVGALVAGTGDEETPDRGRVDIYERVGGGWLSTATLGPDRPGADWQFGAPLALADGGLVVGSGNHGVGGTARYFERNGRDWTRARVLDESDEIRDGSFGQTVAAAENHVAVSGRIRRENRTDRPVVYVFDR
jgi:hypothetical protein